MPEMNSRGNPYLPQPREKPTDLHSLEAASNIGNVLVSTFRRSHNDMTDEVAAKAGVHSSMLSTSRCRSCQSNWPVSKEKLTTACLDTPEIEVRHSGRAARRYIVADRHPCLHSCLSQRSTAISKVTVNLRAKRD